MKIGFLTHGTNTSSSTRIRAMYVAKYIHDSVISNEIKLLNLSSLDAIVFQKRFKKKDVDFAIKLKDKGVQIALDLVDPVWNKDYPACYFDATNDKKEYFDQMVELSDCIVFSTPELEKMFLEYYTGNVTLVIPDRIDLAAHPTLKFHLPKQKYIILWHGTKFNLESLNLARNDLEKLGSKFDTELRVVCEKGYNQLEPFKNLKVSYKIWDLETINDDILDSDITINPHPDNTYKSNNKTIKSWALGVPCIENNFFNLGKMYLSSHNKRSEDAKKMREFIEKFYNSRLSAFEWEHLFNTGMALNLKIPDTTKVLHNVQIGNDLLQKSSSIKVAIALLNDLMNGAYHEGSLRANILKSTADMFTIGSSIQYLETCDVVIYQDRFEEFDIKFVQKYKSNKLFILDLTEPYFYPKYIYTRSLQKDNCMNMIQTVDIVVVSNKQLQGLIKEKLKIETVLIENHNLITYSDLIVNKFQNKFNKKLD